MRDAWSAVVCALFVASCGGGEAPAPDAAVDLGAPTACTSDVACDDGAFCNGAERCMPGVTGADVRGCIGAAMPACDASMACNEAAHSCGVRSCTGSDGDADGDGHRSVACSGDDCDDDDPNAYPGNAEVCDAAMHDEDCDPVTYGFRDADGDGSADGRCCNVDDAGAMSCGPDCDDMAPAVHPSQAESCNGEDDDCDGMIDEGAVHTYHADTDGDGFGDADGATADDCFPPAGFADDITDCDDTRAAVHPGAVEQCDAPDAGASLDEDCDGVVNPPATCMCTGGGSRGCMALGRCAAGTQSCVAGAWSACSIAPMTEICNGEDDDCNGVVDDRLRTTCYADGDDDGYARIGAAMSNVCGACPPHTTNRAPTTGNIDCSDTRDDMHPGAPELCDRRDNDCSGMSATNEDADDDGHTAVGFVGCTGGFPKDDCQDANANVHPGQLTFFSTTYCPIGATRCAACGGACVHAGGLCAPVCSMVVPGSWDYDCSGISTIAPHDGACNTNHCGLVGGCGTSGYTYPGTPACGTSEQYHSCGCGGTFCADTTTMRALACR